MPGPEANFIRRIHKKRLSRQVYKLKTEGGDGVPDFYYEAYRHTLRVEYKVYPNTLSRLQTVWIKRAWENQIPAWVATWHPKHKLVFVRTRETGLDLDPFSRTIDEYVDSMHRELGIYERKNL